MFLCGTPEPTHDWVNRNGYRAGAAGIYLPAIGATIWKGEPVQWIRTQPFHDGDTIVFRIPHIEHDPMFAHLHEQDITGTVVGIDGAGYQIIVSYSFAKPFTTWSGGTGAASGKMISTTEARYWIPIWETERTSP